MQPWRIALIVALLAGTAGAMSFTITDLGTLGGPRAVAYKVNEQGQVSVDSTTTGNKSWQPFLWDAGVRTPAVPLPAGGKSYAFGLNDLGVQVGRQDVVPWTDSRAVMWTGGVPTELPSFGTAQAIGINNTGLIVGSSGPDIFSEGPVYWDASGIHVLPVLAGGDIGAAWDVNEAGWMAGTASSTASPWGQGVLWRPNGTVFEVPGPEALDAIFYALNASGHAVGRSFSTSPSAPIYWDGTSVSVLPIPAGMSGAATGITDGGLIVGFYSSPSWELTGVYWDAAGMHDLNTPALAAKGWRVEAIWGVNEDGWMVGEGLFGGSTRAILLMPIPEASTLWLALGGLGLLVWRRRRI